MMKTNRFVLALCAVALLTPACGADRSDATLAFEVDRTLSEAPELAGTQIQVTARGSAVTLRGVVAREEQRRSAEALALGVSGVESVESQLEIGPAPGAAPPGVAAPPPAETDPGS